jgi:hypothetical protein
MLIGIVGFAGSGKGTVGDILVKKHSFIKLSFADAVKDATSVIFGWPRHLLEGDTDESRVFRECRDDWWSDRLGYEFTPRLAMQLMGTEAGRDVFHRDLWVHTVARRVEGSKANFVIPDVRFPNEIKFIRDNGGFIIRVSRGNDPLWYDTALRANTEGNTDLMRSFGVHHSEWSWIGSQFDYVITNNGTISMLEADVEHLKRVFTGPINTDTIKSVA